MKKKYKNKKIFFKEEFNKEIKEFKKELKN